VLVNDADPGTSARLLLYFEHAISEGRTARSGERRVISRRLQFILLSEDDTATDAGAAPYLDYRLIAADERARVATAVSGSIGLWVNATPACRGSLSRAAPAARHRSPRQSRADRRSARSATACAWAVQRHARREFVRRPAARAVRDAGSEPVQGRSRNGRERRKGVTASSVERPIRTQGALPGDGRLFLSGHGRNPARER
jgi:hypothetical protein